MEQERKLTHHHNWGNPRMCQLDAQLWPGIIVHKHRLCLAVIQNLNSHLCRLPCSPDIATSRKHRGLLGLTGGAIRLHFSRHLTPQSAQHPFCVWCMRAGGPERFVVFEKTPCLSSHDNMDYISYHQHNRIWSSKLKWNTISLFKHPPIVFGNQYTMMDVGKSISWLPIDSMLKAIKVFFSTRYNRFI